MSVIFLPRLPDWMLSFKEDAIHKCFEKPFIVRHYRVLRQPLRVF